MLKRMILRIISIAFFLGFSISAHAAVVKILAYGDSLTAGLGLPLEKSLPSQLAEALKLDGHDVKMINAGVSGDTTSGGVTRLPWTFQDLQGAEKPDVAILALGANDMLRFIPPEVTEKNLDKMIRFFQEQDVKVLLAGMQSLTNNGEAYRQKFDAIYPALAEKYNLDFYPFLLEGVALYPEMNQEDGLHPNEQGVARIVEGLKPVLSKMIAELTQNSDPVIPVQNLKK